jgi:hypothetical protein
MRRLLLATSLVIGLSDSVPAQEWQRDPKIAIASRLGELGVRAFANVAWRDVVKSALAHGGKAQKQCYPEQNFCSTWIDYRFGAS